MTFVLGRLGPLLALSVRMTARWWTPLSIILILLSFIVFGFLSRRPLCIDSKLVERIDRVSTTGLPATVYRCGLHRAVPYDEEWNRQVIPISRRIQNIEKFLDALAPSKFYLKMVITEQAQSLYRVEGHEISMSNEMFFASGSIEKALIKAWLRDHTAKSFGDHAVFEESLTDLIYFAANGTLPILDVELKIGPDLDLMEKWPFVIKSVSGYCRSPWRQMEHIHFCQVNSLDRGVHDTNVIPLSLRPLISQSMIFAYLNLTAREKRQLMTSFVSTLSRIKLEEKNVGFSTIDANQQNFVDLYFEISGIMRSLSEAAQAEDDGQKKVSFHKWVSQVEAQLQYRGFTDQIAEAHLDHLVGLVGINSDRHIAKLSEAATKIRGSAIALVDKDQIYLLPSIEPVKKNLFGSLKASRMTLVACGPVSLSDLSAYSQITDRLTLIESCDESVNINFEGLLHGEIGRFSLQNPSIAFVEIHLPSLQMAIEKKRLDLATRLAMSFDNSALNSAIGWQQPTYDTSIRAYRANSAIEAFQIYRPRTRLN